MSSPGAAGPPAGRDLRGRAVLATDPSPGAIAVFQITGEVEAILTDLTGRTAWPVGRLRLVALPGLDDALAGVVAPGLGQIMPHGGPRVVQRLAGRLADLGAPPTAAHDLPPRALFPEADDDVEALALLAVARATSARAIDLLLDQPRRWRVAPALTDADRARSRRLNRLLRPPLVVLAGAANVGKSTLTNRVLGRDVSIARDRPGTTRDYTAALADLGGLVVRWHDTPGLRASDDEIEIRALALARDVMGDADLLVAVADADHGWPDLPRPADVRVATKADLGPAPAGADVAVSGTTGAGVDDLVAGIAERLVPAADLAHPGPWAFDPRLPGLCSGAGPAEQQPAAGP